jgi:hypothetical protein
MATDYVLSRPFLAPNDTSAAGMQGAPETTDDLTEGQAEERFYQSVALILSCFKQFKQLTVLQIAERG